MIRSLTTKLLPALAVAVLAAPGAMAQPAPAGHGDHGGPPEAKSGMPGMPGMDHEAMMAKMKARHEAMQKQHLDDLRTVLRLRPDQEPALAAFVAAHRPPPGGPMMGRMGPDGDDDAALTTPQRLERQAKREAEMDARRTQQREALAKFYAALSPDQQKVFDAMQRLKGPHGGPGGPGMGGPGMGGHGARMMMMHRGGEGGGPKVIIRRIQGGPDGPPQPAR